MKDLKSIPVLICEQCLKILYEADQFRLKCLEADEYFRALQSELEDQEAVLSQETSQFHENFTINCYSEGIEQVDEIEDKVIVIKVKDARTKVKAKKFKTPQRYRPICGYCGKEQESEYRLKQHELLSHTPLDQISPDEVFVCDFCARIFKTKQSLRNHFIRAHTPSGEKFPCHVCGKVLPHQKALYAHERVHIKTEVLCQYCSKSFSRKVLLNSHIAIVHLKKRL